MIDRPRSDDLPFFFTLRYVLFKFGLTMDTLALS